MNSIEEFHSMLAGTYDRKNWYGPGLKALLESVAADTASARPVAEAHTIHELVRHVAGWIREVERSLEGEDPSDPREWDWREIAESGEEAWEKDRRELESAHRDLLGALEAFPEARLDENVPGMEDDPDLTFRFVLAGLAGHNAYHAGQIALLAKAVRS